MNGLDWEQRHNADLAKYSRQIGAIYRSAAEEAAVIGAAVPNFDTSKPFAFADYPKTKKRVDNLFKSLSSQIETAIVNGVDSQWTLANNKNNELCNWFFGDFVGKLSKAQERRYYSNNDKAREAFKARKITGLGLSDRVWKYTDQFKSEIELGIDLGLRDGLPAAEMARNLKGYLQAPDKLFRRVRDEHGVLRLSQAAKAYHPGQGVYRSSYKNALRLTATETNIAYRTSDHERWQQLDFVIGIEVKKSKNHPVADMCDSLAGTYPKGFKFMGWHPYCRCYAIPILQKLEDFIKDRPITGEVEATPDNYNEWVAANEHRFTSASRTPYFIRDNSIYDSKKVIPQATKVAALTPFAPQAILTAKQIADQRHTARTPRQIKAIQNRWDEREAINVASTNKLYTQISASENEIRMNTKFETAILYDTQGNILIDKRGKATSVSFTAQESKLMKDGILTHNHPLGWALSENSLGRIGNSFSNADLVTMIETDLFEIRAVTPHYTFSMKRPSDGWGLSRRIAGAEISRVEKEVVAELKAYLSKVPNKERLARVLAISNHRICIRLSQENGWIYAKSKTR